MDTSEVEAIGASEPQATPGRRRWPLPVFLTGLLSAGASYVLILVLLDRIVRLGPVDAAVIAALLATVSIWCVAASLMGATTGVARGRVAEFLHLGILVPAIGLIALAVTVVVNLAILLAVKEDRQVQLDVPDGSAKYIVVPFTFGETTLTIYRGNGIVYNRVGTQLPYLNRSSQFADTYRVETGGDGRLHLRYPQDGGKDADVLLP